MQLEIGNGYIFEEKDFKEAIKIMNPDDQGQLIVYLMDCLRDYVEPEFKVKESMLPIIGSAVANRLMGDVEFRDSVKKFLHVKGWLLERV